MISRILLITFFYALVNTSVAQDETDSTVVLKFDEFYSLVLNNHPIVQQAQLLTDQAAQEVRMARGGFDPKLEGIWDFKDFKEQEYYNLLDVSLKIPTWFPIDPKFGVERNRGVFVNPENSIPPENNNRQVYAGIAIPLGKGLFIDERRATVKQALIFQDMAEAEQIKEINKVLLTAAKDYWEWYYSYNRYLLMQQSIALAQDIFDRTKLAFTYGEAAVIDTVQAKITLLKRITDFQQADIDRKVAAFTLSNHLWSPEEAPLELADNVRPEEIPIEALNENLLTELVQLARVNHPELRKLRLKNESLLIDRNMAMESLKPKLDLNYYLLNQPLDPQGESSSITLQDNYKLGVNFSFPIFLRKERGKLKQTKYKIIGNNYQQDFTERQIINDINGQFNAVTNTRNILTQQQQMVDSYQLILQAERLNLQNGESDLFKINIQIDKLIESQSKLLKLKSTYQKSIAQLYWAAGIANLGAL